MTPMSLPPTHHTDEWPLDNPPMRRFIGAVNATRARVSDPRKIVAATRPDFVELLADPAWLPQEFQQPSVESGMGGGIGMWLLSGGRCGLAFSALVVPPGAQTPVHDHLAWGLVGLYKGEQEEEVFARQDDGRNESHAELNLSVRQMLRAGDFYELLPETTSTACARPARIRRSRSICWATTTAASGATASTRKTDSAHPFRSGWINVECRNGEDS